MMISADEIFDAAMVIVCGVATVRRHHWYWVCACDSIGTFGSLESAASGAREHSGECDAASHEQILLRYVRGA